MSYAEYLRRKAATSQTVIDYQPKKVDASQFITQQRLAASALFRLNGREGVINNVSNPSGTGTTSGLKQPQGVVKVSGGYVPDASVFTAYAGAAAIGKDINGVTTLRNTKYVLPANIPESLCTNTFLNGPAAPKSAGDWTRSQAPCTNGREPHNPNELGPSLFVDNTIRLKNLVGCCANEVSDANHTHPADVPHSTRWAPRPEHGRGGIPVSTVSSPSDARKVGDRNPRKVPYVEKHHGNDLLVNPRRVPTRFKLTTGIPHLKINDPFPRGCESCGGTGQVAPSVPCEQCETPQIYNRNISSLPPNEAPVEVSPYNLTTLPCVGDVVNLIFTNGDSPALIDFGITLPAETTVKYFINSGTPVSVSSSGTGPFTYTMDDISLDPNDVFTIEVSILSCSVDSILFRYIVA